MTTDLADQTAAAIALSIKVLRLQRWTCVQIAGAVALLGRRNRLHKGRSPQTGPYAG